jgi:hypothetical protein
MEKKKKKKVHNKLLEAFFVSNCSVIFNRLWKKAAAIFVLDQSKNWW